jgi:glycosyltransferase involved in cell wall biosynthesis
MIYKKLVNTDKEEDVLFDVCIPCYEPSHKLNETLVNILESEYKATLPFKFIICVEKQSVVLNRVECLKYSNSKYVLWLDDDIAFQNKGWDKHLYDSMNSDEKMGLIGINIVHWQMHHLIKQPARPHGEVPALCGAVMFTRKVPEVSIDINYRASQWEDTDMCMQYVKAGYKVFQDNRLHVLHYNEEKNRDYDFNRPYFNKKWGLNW